jgi:glucose dehydrogenase
VLTIRAGEAQEHPGGGCRMGEDPANSVVDSYGRAHDHENLFVVGAPTMVTGGCANGTLTFAALGLRSASRLGKELPARRT